MNTTDWEQVLAHLDEAFDNIDYESNPDGLAGEGCNLMEVLKSRIVNHHRPDQD